MKIETATERSLPVLAALAALLVTAAGCGSASPTDGGVTDLAAVDQTTTIDSTPTPAPDLGPCNGIVVTAPAVAQMAVAEGAPTPHGGPPFANGTFFVTSDILYTGQMGMSGATGVMTQLQSVNLNGNYDSALPGQAFSGRFVLNGASITVQQTCPSETVLDYAAFDSTATSFTLYRPILGYIQAQTFTRQ